MSSKYDIPQVVPEYGGDYSDPIWTEEKETTYYSRTLNRKGKIRLNTEDTRDGFDQNNGNINRS